MAPFDPKRPVALAATNSLGIGGLVGGWAHAHYARNILHSCPSHGQTDETKLTQQILRQTGARSSSYRRKCWCPAFGVGGGTSVLRPPRFCFFFITLSDRDNFFTYLTVKTLLSL